MNKARRAIIKTRSGKDEAELVVDISKHKVKLENGDFSKPGISGNVP